MRTTNLQRWIKLWTQLTSRLTRIWIRQWILCGVIAASLMLTACGGEGSPVATAPSLPLPPFDPNALTVPMPIRSSGSLKLLGLSMSVAGREAELLLDTGSSGLRVLSSAVGTVGLQRTQTPVVVTFGDNTQFIGVVGRAPLGLGGVLTEEPVAIQLIDQVRCAPGAERCSDRLFDGSQDFSGILGTSVGPRTPSPEIFDPLTRFPGNLDSGHIIRTGGFNSSQGTFTIGLTPTNTAGFGILNLARANNPPTFPDGTPVWDDGSLRVNYSITVGNDLLLNSLPGRTIFDTGTSDILINSPLLGGPTFAVRTLPVGSLFRAALPGAFIYSVNVTFPIQPGIDRIFVDATSNVQILGMPFFFKSDVLFDVDQGRIGFLPLG